MDTRLRAIVAATMVLLSSCGGAAVGTSTTRPTVGATPSATGAPAHRLLLIVVAETSASQVTTIRLLKEDGTEVDRFTLKQDARAVSAAGTRVFLRSAGRLKAIRRDGTVEDLQAFPDEASDPLPSPDGTRWFWTSMQSIYDGYSSSAFVSVPGSTVPRKVESFSDQATWLLPVSWTPQGVFIQHMGGIDGYFVFGLPVLSTVERFDPDRGSLAPLPASTGCAFADEAPDGTVACFIEGQSKTLRLVSRGGKITSLTLATPRFNIVGDAYFSPDGRRLTVAGATGVGDGMGNPNPQPEQFGTDLVRVSDGSIIRFGPPGVRLAMGWRSWLPDGKLVLWRPPSAAGGAPGLYVLDPNGPGTGPEIRTGGIPIGYLTV